MPVSTSGTQRPERIRRPSRAEVRRRLLDAAAEVLVSHGYGSASIDTITSAAGLSRGALYSNFADKEDLYLSLLAELERDQVHELAELYDEQGGVDQFLARISSRPPALRHDSRTHLILQTELWLLGTRNPRVRERVASIQRRTIDTIAAVVEGTPPGFTPHEIGAVVSALGDGLMMLRITDPESLREGVVFDVLRALASLTGIDEADAR